MSIKEHAVCDRCGKESKDPFSWYDGWSKFTTDTLDWYFCPRCTGTILRDCARKMVARGESILIADPHPSWRLEEFE